MNRTFEIRPRTDGPGTDLMARRWSADEGETFLPLQTNTVDLLGT